MIVVTGLYLVNVEDGELKGVVKCKYFDQIIPDDLKQLKNDMAQLQLKRFELELEGADQKQLNPIKEEYEKLNEEFQDKGLYYFNRLRKSPSEMLKINESVLQSNPDVIDSIAAKIWTNSR